MNNDSYQAELDKYFQTIANEDAPERVVYKGSLSKARAKLDFEAFIDLNDNLGNYFYNHFEHETWFGFNLLAVDGTTLRVPDQKSIVDHFGSWDTQKGAKPCPKARASQMFDVLNKISVDAIISPKSEGERQLAYLHFLKLQANDLILLDRGYPAFWLFKAALTMGANFCARVSYKKWKIINKFYRSGKAEQIVKLKSTYHSSRKCHEMGLDTEPMKVRLIRVELDSGETEVLITSLTDNIKYPHDLFSDLYHLRWPVEEDYKTLKYRLQVENFSGKSELSVYQDFHAKLFSKNFVAVISTTTKKRIIQKSEKLKYVHQLNFAQALHQMKNTIVLFFHRRREKVYRLVEKIRTIFIQTTEAIKPNRKFPRRHKVKQQRFFFEYKTTC